MSIPQTSYSRPTNITTKQESCNFYLLNNYRFAHTENRVFTWYYRIVIDLVLSSIKLAKIIWYSGSVCACKMSVKVNRVWVREWIKKIVGIKKNYNLSFAILFCYAQFRVNQNTLYLHHNITRILLQKFLHYRLQCRA